jgi:hypothetical protein
VQSRSKAQHSDAAREIHAQGGSHAQWRRTLCARGGNLSVNTLPQVSSRSGIPRSVPNLVPRISARCQAAAQRSRRTSFPRIYGRCCCALRTPHEREIQEPLVAGVQAVVFADVPDELLLPKLQPSKLALERSRHKSSGTVPKRGSKSALRERREIELPGSARLGDSDHRAASLPPTGDCRAVRFVLWCDPGVTNASP